MNCCSEPLGGGLLQDPPRLGRSDDIGNSIDVRGNHRSAAGHAFEQDIGPAFVRQDEQQKVGCRVDVGKAVLWHMAEQANAVGTAVRKSHGLTPAIVVIEGRGEGSE